MTAEQEKKTLARNPRARLEAGLKYMTDPSTPSLERLTQDPQFTGISKRTLERWCKEDKWVERRTAFLERWAAQARERIGSKLVQKRAEVLASFEDIMELAIAKLEDPKLQPKSWEGVLRSLVQASQHSEELRVALLGELMPQTSGEGAAPPNAEALGTTKEEVQEAVRLVLQRRREALRATQPVIDVTPALPETAGPSS